MGLYAALPREYHRGMIQIVIFLQLVLLFAMLGATNYVKKKAKNLADKEDLKDLTLIVQKVKIGFQKVLATHRVQFEAEFRYYEDVWCAARALHKAFVKLLPSLLESMSARMSTRPLGKLSKPSQT